METKNLSAERKQKMIAKIHNLKELHQKDEEVLVALNDIENFIQNKKYGLVWEEHEEKVDKLIKDNIPVFEEVKNKEICKASEEGCNFLLEGDNLHSLKLLEKTHKGKVDIIYIDPPYNTKNKEFIYDDKKIGIDDSYRHSKWASFIGKRLQIAKKLLSKHGVIFISIDDHEQANLKLICDDVFGENNFLGQIVQLKGNAQNDAKNLQKNHEYILAYINNRKFNNKNGKEESVLFSETETDERIYEDEDGYYYIGSEITTGEAGGILNKRKNLGYTIYYNEKTKDKIAIMDYDTELAITSNDENEVYSDRTDLLKQGYIKIRPPKKNGKLGRWTWSDTKFNEEKDNIFITEEYKVKQKIYVDKDKVYKKNKKLAYRRKSFFDNVKSIWKFSTGEGTKALSKIFGEKVFDNPKNVSMIKQLISSYSKSVEKYDNNIIVLDFFAGSGTTAQAVLELNEEDGGKRKFILCTNNENEICEKITYPRIKTVITGKRKDRTKYSEGINANLKYYKTAMIPKATNNVCSELNNYITELIQLEKETFFDNRFVLALTDKEVDNLEKDIGKFSNLQALYFSNDVLFTTSQKVCFKNIEKHIIPDKYYEKEIKEVE